MTASLHTKHGAVYVVLNWEQAGKRRQKWIKTDLQPKYKKKDGEAIRVQVLTEWQDKIGSNYTEMSFGNFLKDWIERKRPTIEESTYTEYRRMIHNTIAPYFDQNKVQLQKCGVADIENFYTYKMEHDGVSANTISHYQANIYSALKDGVRLGIITSNPAERVLLPKVKKFRGAFYTPEEAQQLLSASRGTKYEIPVYLALWFGLRRGEISGLKWSAVNLEHGHLSIDGVMMMVKGERRFQYRDNPKSEAGKRVFPLNAEQIRVFRHWQAQQSKNHLMLGSDYNDEWNEFVCVDNGGNLITPEYISCNFATLLARHGLRKVRFHDLRHTNAVFLLSYGASMHEVQEWLGHESYSTTDEYYSGILAETKRKTANILEGVLPAQEWGVS